MKANELMIDDWVLHNNKPKRVDVIWGKAVSLNDPTQVWGSIYTDKFNEEEIEPIPLTPEILEKNGFRKQNNSSGVIRLDTYWLGEEIGFHLHSFGTDYYQFGLAKIRYVHELQHALKLCGIDKPIIV